MTHYYDDSRAKDALNSALENLKHLSKNATAEDTEQAISALESIIEKNGYRFRSSENEKLLAEAKLYLALKKLRILAEDATLEDTKQAISGLESAIIENKRIENRRTSNKRLLAEVKLYLALKKLRILAEDATLEDTEQAINALQYAIEDAQSEGIDATEAGTY